MYENKEEALKELNKIIDEYGIGFSELKENYSSEKTVNTKKKDKVRSYYIDADKIYYNCNKIHLPIIGDVRITEKSYIPRDSSLYIGGYIIYEHTIDKYYLVVKCDYKPTDYSPWYTSP